MSSSPHPLTPDAIGALSFEEALKALEGIVASLESGKTSLDQSVGAYETGMLLKAHCEKQLEQARLKIEKITIGANGQIGTTDFPTNEG